MPLCFTRTPHTGTENHVGINILSLRQIIIFPKKREHTHIPRLTRNVYLIELKSTSITAGAKSKDKRNTVCHVCHVVCYLLDTAEETHGDRHGEMGYTTSPENTDNCCMYSGWCRINIYSIVNKHSLSGLALCRSGDDTTSALVSIVAVWNENVYGLVYIVLTRV